MKLRTARFRRIAAATSVGGLTFLAAGCDPESRSAVLSALESSTSTLLNAFLDAAIQSLEPEEEPPITTV